MHRQLAPVRSIVMFGVLFVPLVAVAAGCGSDDQASSTTSTTAAATSSTATTTTTTSAPVPGGNVVVWPPEGGTTVYEDPVAAATGFATGLVGFVEPVVGEFLEGDSRSGEVEVRPTADGPVTTVFVRQVGSDSAWSVIGCSTDAIRPSEPAALDEVSSPVQLSGTSTAFEGNVQVAVHDRTGGAALGEGFVTGGSMGEFGPFTSALEFSSPATSQGSVVFATLSMEDGRVWNATVVGVSFGGSAG